MSWFGLFRRKGRSVKRGAIAPLPGNLGENGSFSAEKGDDLRHWLVESLQLTRETPEFLVASRAPARRKMAAGRGEYAKTRA